MTTTTYSFLDTYITINHPSVGTYVMNGQGLGEVNITYSEANAHKDRAADGSIMMSKLAANDGQISLQMQQTSSLHIWLKQYFNFLLLAPSSNWAQTNITVSSPLGTQDFVVARGVSPEKRPDLPYHAEGQHVTWNFLAAEIQMM